MLASSAKASTSGSAYSYAWLSSLTSVIGNYATLSVNMPDFSRYSRASVKWQWLYVPMLPIVFTFISFIGIAATSAGDTLYGSLEWNPANLISLWPNRACRFFAGSAFALAALGVNISANSLSAANDLASLFPSVINIRRGQLACAVLCWILVPWKILASAGSFLNFSKYSTLLQPLQNVRYNGSRLSDAQAWRACKTWSELRGGTTLIAKYIVSAYAVFLGPIGAILVWDFWWVHDRKYDVIALYHPDRSVLYNHPINKSAKDNSASTATPMDAIGVL